MTSKGIVCGENFLINCLKVITVQASVRNDLFTELKCVYDNFIFNASLSTYLNKLSVVS